MCAHWHQASWGMFFCLGSQTCHVLLCLRSLLTVLCVHCRGKRTEPSTPQTTAKRPRVSRVILPTPDTPPSVNVNPLISPSVPAAAADVDMNDDILIMETASTPKPQKTGTDLSQMKTEPEEINISMQDAALVVNALDKNVARTDFAGSAAVKTGPSPSPFCEMSTSTTTTQTEAPKVKQEEQEPPAQTEVDETDTLTGRRSIDLPVDFSSEQRVVEAMAQERDAFKEQVQTLTNQLQDAQRRLQELSQISVKKECSHQGSQTEETGGGKDYKSLFEKAKQKVDELITFLAIKETKSSVAEGGEEDSDDIARQIESLIQELEQRNKKRDELLSQVSVVFLSVITNLCTCLNNLCVYSIYSKITEYHVKSIPGQITDVDKTSMHCSLTCRITCPHVV